MTLRLFEDIMIYYAVVNAAALILFGVDKARARLGAWRVKESLLLASAAIGGAGGALAGMLLFRHKTRKLKFLLPVPALLAAHLAAAALMWLTVR